jgi:hypothetical protein
MELSELEAYLGVVPLYLRKSLEDGGHPTHTICGGSGDQDGHEKRTVPRSYLRLLFTVHSLNDSFTVHHGHLDRPI